MQLELCTLEESGMLKSRQGISSDPTNPEVTAATYEDVARWVSLGQALAQQMLVHHGMDLLLKVSGPWAKVDADTSTSEAKPSQ